MMNDRFKFRAWDKETNSFLIHNEEDKTIDLNVLNSILKRPEKYDVLQCTGLKDKNGKLIYEGDIIVIPNYYPFYDYKNEEDMKQSLNETLGEIKGESVLNYVGIVENIYNCWQYVYHCVNPKKRGISEGINYLLNEDGIEENENSYFEVIGNIYENKELLNE